MDHQTLAQIANKALESAQYGPYMRVSVNGKSLFVKWGDGKTRKYTIPESLAVDILTKLAKPDDRISINQNSQISCIASDYVLSKVDAKCY